MLTFGSLAFLSPWVLVALIALPVLWWLLRVTPPSPRLIRFPAIRLLFRLQEKEDTPAHTPWWLLLLRLVLVTLLIVGLAHPLLNPRTALTDSGPLVLVVDNGWASAPNWAARRNAVSEMLDKAARDDRKVILLTTARTAAKAPIQPSGLLRAADAKSQFQAMKPQPWPIDLSAATVAARKIGSKGDANVVWLSDGLDHKDLTEFVEQLQATGRVTVLTDKPADLPVLLLPPSLVGNTLTVDLVRADGRKPAFYWLRAVADNGRLLTRRRASFGAGATTVTAALQLPTELRNRVARIEVERHRSAGATVLLDESLRRRPVGLATVAAMTDSQPLLSDLYYLERALGPYSELRRGPPAELLQRPLAVLVLTDNAPLAETDRAKLEKWLTDGGVLIRFAGPLLAQSRDDLVPVKLRGGNRSFGGTMSWTKPVKLAAFDDSSPFAGLQIPGDVSVRRQVLAEPSIDLARKTWARLEDGTPLVTAAKRGKGLLVLVHTTANPDWSSLPLSGLFVQMMRRIIDLSRGVAAGGKPKASLPPRDTLDGYGRLGPAPATAVAIAAKDFPRIRVGPDHPPGYYGEIANRRSLNLSGSVRAIKPLGSLPPGIQRSAYKTSTEVDLMPWLLAAALALFILDFLITFLLRGLATGLRPQRGAAAAIALLIIAVGADRAEAQAQPSEKFAIEATQQTRLAYLVTGNPEVDRVSRAGLQGLTMVLRARTSVEPGSPMAVNPDTDDLALFPLLYWPITPDQAPPSARANARLQAYLRSGGLLILDVRNQSGPGTSGVDLRRLVKGLKIPALAPVPTNHVLTRSYYLLRTFPGRWTGGRIWVSRPDQNAKDGVSPVVIGSNDWAGAWAVDELNRPLFAAVPGGARQREMAYRSGVNLVMYALTGNYKADQVHIPTILRRLGQ